MLPKLTFSPHTMLQFILLFKSVYKVLLHTIDPRYSFTDYVFANSPPCLNLFSIPNPYSRHICGGLWTCTSKKFESPEVRVLSRANGALPRFSSHKQVSFLWYI